MKHMPVILLFSSAQVVLSNMLNFDWNPFLVIKWANVMKDYTIYAPPSVIHLFWWYIDTLKIVEYKYLPIDFVIKGWGYPAKIFVNISHGSWDV